MSIYCTLPRRHQFSGINQRRNTVVSAEEARKLVDDLFNPIVEYDCHPSNDHNYRNPVEQHHSTRFKRVNGHEESVYGNYGSNYSETNNYIDLNNSQNDNYSSVCSSKSDHSLISGVSGDTNTATTATTGVTNNQTSNISKINIFTNSCKNSETSYDSTSKLYYAFDNFEDFRRRRKSLAPDFYGGGLTASLYGTDSAYESSSPSIESLRGDPQKMKKKSKYFTLPTRRSAGKTRLKDNIHEIAKRLSDNNIENNISKNDNNISNYGTALSLLPNKGNANQALNHKCVPKNSVNHQKEFHCCCRSGCHLNNPNHSERTTGAHTAGLGLHCCQQILETLWEEPTVEASALARSRRPMNTDPCNSCKGTDKRIEAHMVAAFEQSLSSMTARLQQLNASLELKDCEMDRLRHTIETLKKQGCLTDTNRNPSKQSSNSSNANKVKTASLIRRHTFTNEGKGEESNSRISRQLSVESVSSVSSGADSSISHKSKKKSEKGFNYSSSGWLRSSFSKAFKKNKSIIKRDALSDAEILGNGSGNEGDSSSVPSSPFISFRSDPRNNCNDLNESEVVQELRRQLRDKDMVLTDLRLESLSSAHQLENLKETVNHLRSEMLNLKQDNDRLKRLVSSKSLASSQSSMTSDIYGQNSHQTYGSTFLNRQNGNQSETDGNSIKSLEMEAVTNAMLCDGGKLVTVESGTHIISSLVVTPKTNWEQLDLMIKKSFKNYINRIDSGLGLGLTLDALACYQVGSEKIQRDIISNKSSAQSSNPELLPFGYIVNESHIFVQFKSASDSLVFDTLTPKSIIQRYVNLLNEHRRIILCGPSGTGKTNMAHKLAEYLAIKRAIENQYPGSSLDCCPVGSIATFSVDHKSAKELRAYLTNVAEQCESDTLSQHLPTVIILDNLHHVGSIDEVFNGLIHITHTKCPYIIGTMNQTTCTTANLQLHHNFRWVLCTNNMEPVKGFLGRYLKRKLIETEVKMASNNLTINPELNRIIDWIPKLWTHLNQFLESHSSSDVTIGPRLFSSCPIDISGSQVWFTDLWNYSIIPYVIEATREGIQMYGQRISFVDPAQWVCESYPWSSSGELVQQLLRIKAEDVNYENTKQNNSNESEGLAQSSSDPLLNMLRRLQEAANHSTNYSDSSQPNQSYNQNNCNPNNNTTASVSIVNSGIESTL